MHFISGIFSILVSGLMCLIILEWISFDITLPLQIPPVTKQSKNGDILAFGCYSSIQAKKDRLYACELFSIGILLSLWWHQVQNMVTFGIASHMFLVKNEFTTFVMFSLKLKSSPSTKCFWCYLCTSFTTNSDRFCSVQNLHEFTFMTFWVE